MCTAFLQKHVSVPVEILWQDFKNICITCLDKVPIPSTTNQPQITNLVKHLCCKRNAIFKFDILRKVVSLSTGKDISNVRRNVKRNVEVHITNALLILSKETQLPKSSGSTLKVKGKIIVT